MPDSITQSDAGKPVLKKQRLPSTTLKGKNPEIQQLVLKLVAPELKTAKPANIRKALSLFSNTLQQWSFNNPASLLTSQLKFVPFLLAEESGLKISEAQALITTLSNLATLVACRLITKNLESDETIPYGNLIMLNAANPHYHDRYTKFYLMPKVSHVRMTTDFYQMTNEVFSDYLKILEHHLGYQIADLFSTSKIDIVCKKNMHDFAMCDLSFIDPLRAICLIQSKSDFRLNEVLISRELTLLLPEISKSSLLRSNEFALRAEELMFEVILPAAGIPFSLRVEVRKLVADCLIDPKRSSWATKVDQFSAAKEISPQKLAAVLKLYYLVMTDRIKLHANFEIPHDFISDTNIKLKTEKYAIEIGKPRLSFKQSIIKRHYRTVPNANEKLARICQNSFEAGLRNLDNTLLEIPVIVWQQVYSRLGIVLSDFKSNQNYRNLKNALLHLPQAVSEEFELNLTQVESAYNLFHNTALEMCSYSSGSTWTNNSEDSKFAHAIRLARDLKQVESYGLGFDILQSLGGESHLFNGLAAFDAKLAGAEKTIGVALRNWLYYPVEPAAISSVLNFQSCNSKALIFTESEYAQNRERITEEILRAAAIPSIKRESVYEFISVVLAVNSTIKWPVLIEEFAKKHSLPTRALSAAVKICCNQKTELIKEVTDRSLVSTASELNTTKKQKSSEVVSRLSHRIVNELHINPQVLYFALCSLELENDNVRAYREFGDRIIRAPYRVESSAPTQSPLDIIQELIQESVESGYVIRYDDLFRDRICDLFKQLCYRNYEGNFDDVLTELERCQKLAETESDSISLKIISTLLSDITPRLIQLFSEIKNYKDPSSVRVTLLRQQIEGVIGAIEFGKPLLLYGTGAGKTEIGASYCEKIQAEKVLWGTKTSSVYDTASNLRDKILTSDAGSVGVLDASLINVSSEVFKNFLEANRYIVAGYDTLRFFKAASPENYAQLQIWIKNGAKVLDELHVLDNPRSGRSRAIQGLVSENTVSLTATPFQHRPERVATILHLCLPEIFNNPAKLVKELRENRSQIRELINAYATIYNITDLAQHFEESEVPLADQISADGPRIPRVEFSRKTYLLSDEHSRLYLDIAMNYNQFAEQRKIPKLAIHQVTMLQRLISDPVRLGAGPALALLSAAKEVALPLLNAGEKVLFFGYRRSLLELIASDPEFQQHGIVLLDGRMKAKERSHHLGRLENDPDCCCAAIQPKAAGSGHNCRSVSQIIVLDCDRRWLTSDRIQAFGRPVRLLFPEDARFARLKVNITVLEPVLQPEIVSEVTTHEARKRLERGTIYSSWLAKDERALKAFQYYTARGRGFHNLPQASSAEALVQSLGKPLDRANFITGSSKLFSDRSSVGFYNNSIKNAWRQVCHGEFLAQEIKFLGKDPAEIRVAHFAGPEALEIPWYLELGIKPENIYGFSIGTKEQIEICRASVLRHGCQFIGSSAQSALPLLGIKFDIMSIDPEGYSTDSLGQMIVNLKLADNSIIIKNALAAREKGLAKEMLKRAGTKREYLDIALMKLCATAGLTAHKFESMLAALKIARLVRATAKVISSEIANKTDLNSEDLADFISEIYLGSRHIQAFSQIRYQSGSGSPFLSTCVRSQKWDSNLRDAENMLIIRAFVQQLVNDSLISGIKTRPSDISLVASARELVIRHETSGIVKINIKALRKAVSYFNSAVPKQFRLSELLKYDIPMLKIAA